MLIARTTAEMHGPAAAPAPPAQAPAERVRELYGEELLRLGASELRLTASDELALVFPTGALLDAYAASILLRDEIAGARLHVVRESGAVRDPIPGLDPLARAQLAARLATRFESMTGSVTMRRDAHDGPRLAPVLLGYATDRIARARIEQLVRPAIAGVPLYLTVDPRWRDRWPGVVADASSTTSTTNATSTQSAAPAASPAAPGDWPSQEVARRYAPVLYDLGAIHVAATAPDEITVRFEHARRALDKYVAAGLRDQVDGVRLKIELDNGGSMPPPAYRGGALAHAAVKLWSERLLQLDGYWLLDRSPRGSVPLGLLTRIAEGTPPDEAAAIERLLRLEIDGHPLLLEPARRARYIG